MIIDFVWVTDSPVTLFICVAVHLISPPTIRIKALLLFEPPSNPSPVQLYVMLFDKDENSSLVKESIASTVRFGFVTNSSVKSSNSLGPI